MFNTEECRKWFTKRHPGASQKEIDQAVHAMRCAESGTDVPEAGRRARWTASIIEVVEASAGHIPLPVHDAIIDALMFTPPPCPREQVIREAIDLLSATRHTFKSKQLERIRHLLEEEIR